MDLRSGESLWLGTEGPAGHDPTLDQDISCEVAIVGGGITGTLVAHYLLREGVDTVLLDKHAPGMASTVASTGLLQYEVDTPLSELIKKVGEASAVRSYRLGLQAIDEFERIAAELSGSCGFSRQKSLYLASSNEDLADLKTEYECRSHYGFDVDYLSADEIAEIGSFRAPGAICSTGDAELNPVRFTRNILTRARTQGLRTYRAEVNQVLPDANGVVLTTAFGIVKARRVVIATGYAAHRQLKQDLGSLHSTYALASEPLATFEGWPERCLLWETARPYFYLRSTPDGRAIIGGEDTDYSEDHAHDGLLASKAARLKERFESMFPQISFVPEFVWAGTFAETKDGLPYIGESPELPHAYFTLGYGGNGITFSLIAARIIADGFVGRPNMDAPIFRFDR
jgi:glycine/D-amino acid oxidase-like deaminating enzyme